MAAPTNVRVEAISQDTAVLRWSYAGANGLDVYRSTDGASFTRITLPALAASVLSYTNVGLAGGTKYWYKVSDDNGSTFSTTVTVWTHVCSIATPSGVALPRFDEEVDPAQLNDLALIVEAELNKIESEQLKACTACVNDGALVIDCECAELEVVADQTINSISIINCEDKSTNVTFVVPPNTTVGIGGWPRGIGFTGDEAFTAPINGGSSGVSINEFVNKALNKNSISGTSKKGTTTQGTSSGGASTSSGGSGGTCQCVPGTNGELTIKLCKNDGSPNDGNSLNCATGSRGVKAVVCGGRGPYTWSSTGGLQLSETTGGSINVTPPVNAGSGVAGDAYATGTWHRCNGGANQTHRTAYGCNDQITSPLAATASNSPFLTAAPACAAFISAADFPIPTIDHSSAACTPNCDGCPSPALSNPAGSGACDMRSGAMIAAGCAPCGLVANGATVSVTDALGTVTTVIMAS